jgi:hypothetical protein
MQKIRITKTPKTGDQRDFSLVHKQAHYINDGETVNPVKNTMGAVPIEQANIEVEGGETVVGDVNRDGFLEHMTFVGKRHSQGGMPVNIPEGSFIFSDTKKLKIKDKEILSKVFGLSAKKGGYTPAEIAKKYQINNYIHDLKSESTDPITKRSATQMLANNMEKLGMLALVQESMKGFPDGIPAIAESVMAGLQGGGAEEMPQGKFGGLMKAQKGGTFDLTYTPQTTIYVNGVPFKYESHYDADLWGTGDIVTFRAADGSGRYYKTNSKKLVERIDSGEPADLGYKAGRVNKALITSTPGKSYYDTGKNTIAGKDFSKGTKFYLNNKMYEVEDPYAAKPPKPLTGPFLLKSQVEEARVQPALKVYEISADGKKKSTIIDGKTLEEAVKNKTFDYLKDNKTQTSVSEVVDNPLNQQSIYTNKQNAQTRDGEPFTVGQYKDNKWYNVYTGLPVDWKPQGFETEKSKPAVKQTATKPATPKPAVKPKTYSEVLSLFAMGGQLPEYQQGAEAKTTQPETETLAGTYTLPDGKVAYVYYTATEKIVKDVNGNVQDRAPRTDKAAYAPHKGDKNPSLNPITGQVETGWNKSKYTADQIDALARERGYNGPKNNKALQQWILSKPEFSKVVEELHAKYKIPAAGIKDDGFWGVRWDDILEKIPSVPSTTTTPAPVTGAQQPVTPEEDFVVPEPAMPQAPKKGPWWLQDITNFVGTLTDDINRYEPTQGRVALQTPGYVTLDPTRRLAANQEQFARMQQMTENTVDGNVGLASMTGTQGQSFANAANVLGDVENANVGIVNQAYNTNAQIMNQEAAANEVGRQKYVEDMATLNQQLDNAEQQNKWRQIAAFNNGTSNWFRKKQMEEVLFPDVYVDPILGDVSIDPSGRSLFGPDTYSPSYMDNRGSNNMMSGNAGIEEWNAIVQEATPIMGLEEAKKYATVYMGNQMRAQNRAVTGLTPRQQYNQMAIQGLTLPLPPREFGGMVYFPWSDIE